MILFILKILVILVFISLFLLLADADFKDLELRTAVALTTGRIISSGASRGKGIWRIETHCTQ